MKAITLFLTSIALTICLSFAEEEVDYAKLEPSIVSKAIAHLLNDPLSVDADEHSALIVKFAQASPLIKISLSKRLLPWLADEQLPKSALRLTSAYVAGNVAHQIELGRAEDSPAAGVTAALQMYRKLRATESLPVIPIMERWAGMTPKEIVEEAKAKKN